MKKLIPFLLIFIIVLIPFIIGKLIILPIDMGNIAGNESDWLLFWATYLGASATAIMAWLTYKMFQQNKDLLDTQKLRWETERRGILIFSIVIIKGNYCLRVQNIGLSIITDISFSFNCEFLDCLPSPELKHYLSETGKKGLRLNPSANNDYFVFPSDPENDFFLFNKVYSKTEIKKTIDSFKEVPLELSGKYKTIEKKYIIDEKFMINSFVANALTQENEIEKELKSIKEQLGTINLTIKNKKNGNG